jgi:class 3 adenylate cyclase/tetratricopeptide (TPR) repeat protein
MASCPACGFDNAGSAKFCSECGAPLTAVAPSRREERKVVTVVFADLVGSTARAERLDPEDVRAILTPFHDRLRHELERHGGTVEKFIGDAVVGVFGAPVAHEDDAERAVRAALSIQSAIAELNEVDPSLALEVRIGVNTGEALVALDARPERGEAMVAGDVMNTGARLQSAAPPGAVLVSESTKRLTARTIEYDEAEPVTAKGKAEPLGAWIATAPRARFGVDVFQKGRGPLVGRERELDLVADALSRARAEREPQLVTLVGVPGIGKSRLVYQLWRIVDEDPDLIVWRQGRSLPYGQGVAFWALGEIVKAQAGILESDGAAEAGAKLSATVGDFVSAEETEWVERHLRPLVGLGGDADPGQAQRAEAFAAWRLFFEALAERGPAVIVFEDLQWADDGLLDFVDSLTDRLVGVPLLVVCSARPELLERRPGWGGGKRNALSVSLAPLSEVDIARLLAILLERSVLPAEEQADLLQRAGGNPLYAEEYARMLADGAGVGAEAPATLQGVVAARIDALSDDEKSLLQQASVLGKVFWTDALAALAGTGEGRLDDLLYSLERKEFVRRDHRSAVAGAQQYVFVHALVRDGAYGQMPRAARAEAHRRVAEWIDALPSDRAEDRAEMLAHHLVQAVEYGRAAGLDVTALLPRAAGALRDAGDRVWALGEPSLALGFYERLGTLDPAASDDPYLLVRVGRARLLVGGKGEAELERASAALADSDPATAAVAELLRGEVIWQRGEHDLAFAHFERAQELDEGLPVSPEKLFVVSQVARFLTIGGQWREGLELAEQAIAMGEELGDREWLGDALNTRGVARCLLGEPDGVSDLERSLELGLELKSARALRAYINLGTRLAETVGDMVRSRAVTREGLEFAQRLGLELTIRWLQTNLADDEFMLGNWEEALRLVEIELADPEPHYQQAQCRNIRSYVRMARDEEAGAIQDMEIGLRRSREIRDPQALVPALAHFALVYASAGDTERAKGALAELAVITRALDAPVQGASVVIAAFALAELGREAELAGFEGLALSTPWGEAAQAVARGDLGGAADLLHERGAATFEAHARLRAARRLTQEGRHADVSSQLTAALAFYRSVGATAAIREGEALLAAAS